jgi:predicted RNase H-like HicB family nuclease
MILEQQTFCVGKAHKCDVGSKCEFGVVHSQGKALQGGLSSARTE